MGALAAPWGVHWQWNKSWSRILKIRILRYVLGAASTPQLQWLLGSSLASYTRWIAAQGCQPVVDEIGEGARLLWLGDRRYDRMILYVPGKYRFSSFYGIASLRLNYLRWRICVTSI